MPTRQTHEPERPAFNMASSFYFGVYQNKKKELDILIDQNYENTHAQQLEIKRLYVVGPDPLISNSSPRATKTQETQLHPNKRNPLTLFLAASSTKWDT